MIEEIAPSEFIRRSNSGELWQLLGVRETWEINIARIEGTIDIPMNEIPARHVEHDAALPVAVLCHSGGRSGQVAHYLAQHSLDGVANIGGGIDESISCY